MDRIVVLRHGRICANLKNEETKGKVVVACITGAKPSPKTQMPRSAGCL